MTTRGASSLTSIQTSQSFGPGSAEDVASSLRAAALLTLRSKRRKVNPPTVGPPLRSAQRPSPPLGNDLGMPTLSLATMTATLSVSSVPELEEGQAREEGEISDSEETSMSEVEPNNQLGLASPPPPPPSPPRITEMALDTPQQPTQDIPPELRVMDSSLVASFAPPRQGLDFLMDENHVRPNLACQ
jgi:hypothetical protein